MGRRRKSWGRKVNGIVLLDKPVGISSNDALQRVKRLFNADKAGHTGNLDPLASGLLPICLGEATKLSAFLLDADKVYIGVCKLGQTTTTADAEGEVIKTRPVEGVDLARVEAVLDSFRGEIEQVPPMHSAIKYQGQPLYKLAHQGIEVERKARKVTIYELRLLEMSDDELTIFVHCSKGTYIRTLAEDIGEMLGCGAYLSALRRTAAGPFREEGMVTLETLAAQAEQGQEALDSLIQPMEMALADRPEIRLSETALFYVRQGQPVLIPKAPTEGFVRLLAPDDQFIGVGHILDDGRVAPKRLLHTG